MRFRHKMNDIASSIQRRVILHVQLLYLQICSGFAPAFHLPPQIASQAQTWMISPRKRMSAWTQSIEWSRWITYVRTARITLHCSKHVSDMYISPQAWSTALEAVQVKRHDSNNTLLEPKIKNHLAIRSWCQVISEASNTPASQWDCPPPGHLAGNHHDTEL